MPRTCTICKHEKLDEINQALIRSDSLKKISAFCGISVTSLHRHKKEHLPVSLLKAKDAAEVVIGENLLESIRALHERTLKILAEAEAAGKLETALKAIQQARAHLELLAKLDGQLKDTGHVAITVNYVDRPIVLPRVTQPVTSDTAYCKALTGLVSS